MRFPVGKEPRKEAEIPRVKWRITDHTRRDHQRNRRDKVTSLCQPWARGSMCPGTEPLCKQAPTVGGGKTATAAPVILQTCLVEPV